MVAGANGSWSLVTTALLDGNHSFTATATDASGNVSAASSAKTVIVDTALPVNPTIGLQSVDSGVAGDNITNVKVVSLTGVAEINSTIKIYDGATLLGSAVANQAQSWAFTTAPLIDGVHNFTVTSTDAAGNVSAASTLNVTIDTVAPNAPVITGNTIVNTNQVQLTGTAAAGSTVKLFDGTTVLATLTANASGAWSFTTGALPGGAHVFTATASDVAGNTSAASSSVTKLIGATVIESNGATSLTAVGSNFYLYDSTGAGPSLKYNGADLAAGQFGGWSPISRREDGERLPGGLEGGRRRSVQHLDHRQQRQLRLQHDVGAGSSCGGDLRRDRAAAGPQQRWHDRSVRRRSPRHPRHRRRHRRER